MIFLSGNAEEGIRKKKKSLWLLLSWKYRAEVWSSGCGLIFACRSFLIQPLPLHYSKANQRSRQDRSMLLDPSTWLDTLLLLPRSSFKLLGIGPFVRLVASNLWTADCQFQTKSGRYIAGRHKQRDTLRWMSVIGAPTAKSRAAAASPTDSPNSCNED